MACSPSLTIELVDLENSASISASPGHEARTSMTETSSTAVEALPTTPASPARLTPVSTASRPTIQSKQGWFEALRQSKLALCGSILTVLGFIVAVLALAPAYRSQYIAAASLELDRWTALKEFREMCLSMANANMTLSHDCQKAIETTIPAPPHAKLSTLKLAARSVLQDLRPTRLLPFEPTLDNFCVLFCSAWLLFLFVFLAIHLRRFLIELQQSKGWWVLQDRHRVLELDLLTEIDLARFDEISLWDRVRLMLFHGKAARRRLEKREAVVVTRIAHLPDGSALSTGVPIGGNMQYQLRDSRKLRDRIARTVSELEMMRSRVQAVVTTASDRG